MRNCLAHDFGSKARSLCFFRLTFLQQDSVGCFCSDENTMEGTVALSLCLQILFSSGSLNSVNLVIESL
jgi:hypothetical protein